jgi:hypothetical protein
VVPTATPVDVAIVACAFTAPVFLGLYLWLIGYVLIPVVPVAAAVIDVVAVAGAEVRIAPVVVEVVSAAGSCYRYQNREGQLD